MDTWLRSLDRFGMNHRYGRRAEARNHRQLRMTVLCVSILSCSRVPDSLPLPAQYVPPAASTAPEVQTSAGLLYEMSDANASDVAVEGLLPAQVGAPMRWTNAHPRFRVHVKEPAPFDFYMRFRVIKEAFQTHGAVTVTVKLNGHSLVERQYRTEDDHELRMPVPASLAAAPGPVEIAVDVSPGWPLRGQDYGVLLQTIGLRRRGE